MRRLPPVLAVALCILAGASSAAAQPRIVGGSAAPAGRFDYVANIAISGAFGCTGTLIAPGWVVTAGHCASSTGGLGIASQMTFAPSAYTVTLGTVNTDGSGGEAHAVKSVHLDPGYTAANGTGSDVSLLELATPSAVTPVKIVAPRERSIWEPGDSTTIAGFGITAEGGSAPGTLQAAQVPIVTDDACAAAYSDTTPVAGNAFDRTTAVCAGRPEGGTDTCQGDSGGPLLAPLDGTSAVRLVGATSYGEGCAREGKPGVYARLAEGPVKAFVSGLVPDAYATDRAPPAATCAGTRGLALRVRPRKGTRLRRAKVILAGRTIVDRRGRPLKAFTVRLAGRLPHAGVTVVEVVTISAGGRRRTATRIYERCQRTA